MPIAIADASTTRRKKPKSTPTLMLVGQLVGGFSSSAQATVMGEHLVGEDDRDRNRDQRLS